MKAVTFRAPAEKIPSLDAIAELQQRDRSFILNEAVDQYLSLQEYRRGLMEEGLRHRSIRILALLHDAQRWPVRFKHS